MTSTRKEVNENYKKIMQSARLQMNVFGKICSYIIHTPVIEPFITLLVRTVLRPIPVFTAALASLIGGLGIYGIVLYNGYSMNNSAIPLLLLGGLFIGIIIDYFRIIFGGSS